jgi:hypothetical protein
VVTYLYLRWLGALQNKRTPSLSCKDVDFLLYFKLNLPSYIHLMHNLIHWRYLLECPDNIGGYCVFFRTLDVKLVVLVKFA